jgi:hypothetical protein
MAVIGGRGRRRGALLSPAMRWIVAAAESVTRPYLRTSVLRTWSLAQLHS